MTDWLELIIAVLTFGALWAVWYQIRRAKIERREDSQSIEMRHQEDIQNLHVIAKNSTDQLSILSNTLNTITDQQLSESDRRKKEAEARAAQRRLDIRPFFTYKMGGTREGGWSLTLINQGGLGAKEFSAKEFTENIMIQKYEFPYHFGLEEAARILGTVTDAKNPREQGETVFGLVISFKDTDGNQYEQTIDYPRGAWNAPNVSDPVHLRSIDTGEGYSVV